MRKESFSTAALLYKSIQWTERIIEQLQGQIMGDGSSEYDRISYKISPNNADDIKFALKKDTHNKIVGILLIEYAEKLKELESEFEKI